MRLKFRWPFLRWPFYIERIEVGEVEFIPEIWSTADARKFLND